MRAYVLLNLLNELGKRSYRWFSPTSLINSKIRNMNARFGLSYDTNIVYY